ncbi:hypothetical protein [Methylobacterium nonmethylotrophicum]|uniref:Uncharacterized protein n=1 Tax=Methylobacterium nonmethylotrophicum TaxID=1141884 RepID=A0A4Z0NIM2_9HYPH|nr:hypothetical protein [Methylobacterium nonmethylotrophicum]TGD95818.1 hypothetical protein EU555_26425 [Methylobacterium nonmethylotrophicum]
MKRLLLASLLVLPLRAFAAEGPSPDDTARFLAGMPVAASSPLARLQEDRSWLQHANAFGAAFGAVEQRQMSRIRAWSGANLPARRSTVFYFFSGPDFLYANSFFPDATTYVMAGLEPVGAVPDLSRLPRASVPGVVRSLQTSIRSVLHLSFFKTIDMRSDLRASQASGALPVLYVFLARSGKTVRSTEFVRLDASGQPTADGRGAQGVKITFASAGGPEQTLYYFSTNLANDGFRTSGIKPFCERLGVGDGLVKSASYLLHDSTFSDVRAFLLRQTATIVQDDTGVPAALFDAKWQLRPYGSYHGPIAMFSGRYQPRMAELFRREPRGALGFGIGYRHRPNESSLVVATKRETALAQ